MMFVPMKVPLLDLRRQNLPLEAELVDAFRRVLTSGQFIQGPEVEQFESAAAAVAFSALCSPANCISSSAHKLPPCQTSQRVTPSSCRSFSMRHSELSEKP